MKPPKDKANTVKDTLFMNRLFIMLVSLALLLPSAVLAADSEGNTKDTDKDLSVDSSIATPGAYTLTITTEEFYEELMSRAREFKADKNYFEAANSLLGAAILSEDSKGRELRIEAARLYGWSGRYDIAEAIYGEILKKEPESKRARLGLAQIYSWSGRHAQSLQEYARVLKLQPGNPSALLGQARVKSWMGDYDGAIKGFSALLKIDPDNNEAREAKARTLWWQGKHASSIKELERILEKKPDNKEIKRLKRRVEWDAGPTLSVKGSQSSDSDSNEINSLKAIVYINHNTAGKLHFEFTRYNVSRKKDKGHATVLTIRNSTRVTGKLKIKPTISLINSKSGPASNSYMTVGVRAEVKINKRLRGTISARRSPYLDTAQLIRNNIRVTSYSGTLSYDIKKRTTLSASAGFNDYSDSNTSYTLRGNLAHTVFKEPDYTITAGYIPEYREFSKTTSSGYYNPPRLFSNDLYLNIKGLLYNDDLVYNATITAGLQNSSTKTEYTGALRIGATYYIKENFNVEAEAKWSKSALETSTGYRSETYKAGLNYLF